MIYAAYIVVAAIVVFLSVKASEYVDMLDKRTKLSGAFIGGVLLSAVTSLPELFTSLSATSFLDRPGLCMGNILGSDLFNSAALCAAVLIGIRGFHKARIAGSHALVTLCVCLIYGVLILNQTGVLDVQLLHVNLITLFIIALYIFGVWIMSKDDGEDGMPSSAAGEESESDPPLSVRSIVIRFILVGIGIIIFSILITYITDEISDRLDLGAGLAGALFLGIATSLPELSSTVTLFKIKNHNIAVGNIVGSNIFNFIIIALADLVYLKGGVYDYSDPKTVDLLICGALAMPLLLILLRARHKTVKFLCAVGVTACYGAFLLL